MCSSGGLGKGVGWGVLGFRLRIKFIDVRSSAQHRPELQSPAHIQEELTLLAPCGKSPPPPAYSPSLAHSLTRSLPPAHPDVIKEFSSCLFALGCSCSPCFTPDHVYMCVYACAHETVYAPLLSPPPVALLSTMYLLEGDCCHGSVCARFVCQFKWNSATGCPAGCGF